mgnify:CR=1 FL=1
MFDQKDDREELEKIDRELLRLLDLRAELSLKKRKSSAEEVANELPPSESSLIETALKETSFFPEEGLRRVMIEIVSWCRKLERPVSVGFLGPEGTFSHQASFYAFGSAVKFVPLPNIDDIFTSVEKRTVDYGLVAIENSTGGVVHDVLDRFLHTDVSITSEIVLYIRHCLISNLPLEKITRIFSHPQPFIQCREWLKTNLPNAEFIETSSTVEGVKRASEEEYAAAIGSEMAARLYDMNVVADNIQDRSENYTRFVILGNTVPEPTESDKTSIILSLKHKPGTLFESLKPFAERGINLSKIESRPTRQRPWEYVFFIDFEGHVKDQKVQEVLKELEPHCLFVKRLGSYPRADEIH